MAIKERPNKPAKKRAKAKKPPPDKPGADPRQTAMKLTSDKPVRISGRNSPRKTTRAKEPPPPKAAHPAPPSPRRRAAVLSPPSARPRALILQPGIHPDVPHLRYHEDPAPEPSMSASFLRKVYETSCRHAWLTHPRLNPAYKPEPPSKEMDFGSAAHAHLLGSQPIQIVKADNWRKDSSRLLRDHARGTGMAPVLQADAARIGEMVRRLRRGLRDTELRGVFDPGLGMNEAVAIWKDEGVYFRARADRWIPPAPGAFPHGLIVDYKTTGISASAEDWSSSAFNVGSDWQSVLYPDGFAMAMNQSGGNVLSVPAFRYVVQEDFEPFEFQVFAPSAITIEHTRSKISTAFAMAHAALKMPVPPGYPRLTAQLEPPVWELKRAERAALAAQMMWKP